jgi:hypothetical protein
MRIILNITFSEHEDLFWFVIDIFLKSERISKLLFFYKKKARYTDLIFLHSFLCQTPVEVKLQSNGNKSLILKLKRKKEGDEVGIRKWTKDLSS